MLAITAKLINEIAQDLDTGMIVYVNPQTGEVLTIPDEKCFAGGDFEAWEEDIAKVENAPNEFKVIEAMDSHNSFKVMEEFAEQLSDKNFQQRVFDALSHKKPFANFNALIHSTTHEREQWFSFKTKALERWVLQQLEISK